MRIAQGLPDAAYRDFAASFAVFNGQLRPPRFLRYGTPQVTGSTTQQRRAQESDGSNVSYVTQTSGSTVRRNPSAQLDWQWRHHCTTTGAREWLCERCLSLVHVFDVRAGVPCGQANIGVTLIESSAALNTNRFTSS